jgi:lipoprotein-releasing system ATP-binding protein
MALLRLSSVSKEFITGNERLHVLDSLSLEIEEGTVVIVTGESGSGKSTMLNLIAGLDVPTGGEIHVDGFQVQTLREDEMTVYRSSVVGLVFQFHYLLRDFTTLENVMLPAFMAGTTRNTATARAEELLRQVGLSERIHHFPTQLSGGERQRAAVARALINDPKIILADEPTGNLDAGNSRIVRDMLFSLVKNLGKTLVLVTHDLSLAEAGDRHMHLREGRLDEL